MKIPPKTEEVLKLVFKDVIALSQWITQICQQNIQYCLKLQPPPHIIRPPYYSGYSSIGMQIWLSEYTVLWTILLRIF